jgi:glycosyltransferase A (GT-A) superfamily protein (DUF2064 family)
MAVKRNALLLFCKPPVPGQVKTRLTRERGGNLTSEQAAEFFRRSLLDITDLALLCLEELTVVAAGRQSYDLVISTTAEQSIHLLEQMFAEDAQTLIEDPQLPAGATESPPVSAKEQPASTEKPPVSAEDPQVPVEKPPASKHLRFIVDKGASFDDHFDDAFAQLFARGYGTVVAIGGDMPTLPRAHIIDAFCWLNQLAAGNGEGQAFVMAPCQQSGVSLVGQTAQTPINSQGVYYNLSGLPALDAYAQKLEEGNIPCAYLAPVSDVDEDHDLAHCISCLNAIAAAYVWQTGLFLPSRVLEWVDNLGLKANAPPNENHDPRQNIDIS